MDRPRAWKRILWIVGSAALAGELVLQGAAWCAWRSDPLRPTGKPTDPHLVLCVGDAATAGMWVARADAWPARLEAVFRQTGDTRRHVVNGAHPWFTAAMTLRKLPHQLRSLRPGTVVLCFGLVDPADQVVEVVEPAAAEGFPLRWRTGDLASAWLGNRVAPDPRACVIGTWHRSGAKVHFRPDGSLEFGTERLRWSIDPQTLTIENDTGNPQSLRWQRRNDRLELWSNDARIELNKMPETLAGAVEHAWLPEARRFLHWATRDNDSWPTTRALMVELDAREGRRDAAARGLGSLRQYHAERGDAGSAALLVRGLLETGEIEEAVTTALPHLAHLLVDPALRRRMWEWVRGTDQQDRFVAAVAKLAAQLDSGHVAWAHLLAVPDLCAHLDLPDAEQRLLETAQQQREQRLRAYWEAVEPILEQIVMLVQRHGARAILADSPEATEAMRVVCDRVAARTGATRVPLDQAFAQALAERPRGELFVAPGACTEHGHQLVARTIADALLR